MEIYTPNTKSVKDYKLGESIDVTINGQAVIPILADKIYKSPYSAVRELYVNEVTAVKKALRINPKLKPKIIISLNSSTRELIIKGVDSLGMDKNTFKYILAVMGNSGNNKGEETGYYGLGFYSFVKLSERILINSYSLESGEKWACVAKSALKFEFLPDDSYSKLNKTGFEITLSIKNDLDLDEITKRVKEISKLSGVNTSYLIDKVNVPLEQYDSLEHYFKSYYSNYFDNKAHYSLMYEYINNDDFELIVGYTHGHSVQLKETFLINVPIELEIPTYDFPQICLLNVKNERIYKPSADRERFAEKDEDNLLTAIKEHTFDYGDKLPEINNLDEWYASKYKYFYDRIGDLSLSIQVKDGKEKDYYERVKRVDLSQILPTEKPDEFRISLTLRTKSFKKYEDKNIFACQLYNSLDYDRFIKIGFIDIDAGKSKSNSYKSNLNRLTNVFKFHNRYNKYDELPKSALAVIRVDDIRDNNLKNKMMSDKIYFITKRANYNGDLEIKIDDLETLLNKNEILATNQGFITVNEILKSQKHSIYENSNRDFEINDESDDYAGKYMMKLFNYKPDRLIIRFNDNNDKTDILKTILRIKHGYIYDSNIDFKAENEKIKDNIYEEWKITITNKYLKVLLDSSSPSWNDEDKEALTELQKEIDILKGRRENDFRKGTK